MRYVKADNVLPEEIIKLIQDYIDGEYLYIPRKCENQKSWGEKNGTKDALRERNREIFMKYSSGAKALDLAEEYFLSEPSIRRIISKERKRRSEKIAI